MVFRVFFGLANLGFGEAPVQEPSPQREGRR